MNPSDKITELKGIGEKTYSLFQKTGVNTLEDLIHYYPRDYDTFEEPVPISKAPKEETAAVYGKIKGAVQQKRVRNLQILNAVLEDDTGTLLLTWFQMPYLKNTLKSGADFVVRGLLRQKGNQLSMEQPAIYTREAYQEKISVMQPVYSLTAGLTNTMIVKAQKQCMDQLSMFRDYLPDGIRRKYELAEYNFSISAVHFPKNRAELQIARKRLIFDEFFLFITALRKMKTASELAANEFICNKTPVTEQVLSSLPYALTNAQKKVWKEIQKDFTGKKAMNRLIQGDVGSGKTIIAVLALLEAAANGYQGAIMAPTEVLAKQHYQFITELLLKNDLEFHCELLVGSMAAKEKRKVYDRIELGITDIIIGTHALIQERVNYHALALVITDEQHRFGVRQRETFFKKGSTPHVLVMSATPIPRTFAIVMYGDLDVSVIDELPSERLPIKNCVVNTGYRETAYRFMEKEIAKGHQIYIICPMVEESETIEAENVIDYAEKLKQSFSSHIKIDYLHGKMKSRAKEAVMEAFAANEIQILVSTTVVEVGVNVPNATVMMIENAERFGLAQLHQLRGRVGRGNAQSYCIFMSSSDKKETMKRLEILNQSNDGFFIASEDLKLRGPGDLFGIRQSGLMDFKIADVFTDMQILNYAVNAATQLLEEDEKLEKPENQLLKEKLSNYMDRTIQSINL